MAEPGHERGRTVDVDALRRACRSPLSKSRLTARAGEGHSSLNLTMKAYTGPSLLDVARALGVLRKLSLEGSGKSPLAMQWQAAERLAGREQEA